VWEVSKEVNWAEEAGEVIKEKESMGWVERWGAKGERGGGRREGAGVRVKEGVVGGAEGGMGSGGGERNRG